MKAPKNSKRPSHSAPNPKHVQNSEVFQRLNFLHQAAHYLATATSFPEELRGKEPSLAPEIRQKPASPTEGRSETHPPPKRKLFPKDAKLRKRTSVYFQPIDNLPMVGLSRILSKSMKVIAKKAVMRMDPSVKRNICRSCHLLLLPGYTSSTRLLSSGSHRHKVKIACLACGHQRKIPHPPHPITTDDVQTNAGPSRKTKEQRQTRPLPFWKQPQHVTFAGQKIVEGSI